MSDQPAQPSPEALPLIDQFALQISGRFDARYDWSNEDDYRFYAEKTYKLAQALLNESRKQHPSIYMTKAEFEKRQKAGTL